MNIATAVMQMVVIQSLDSVTVCQAGPVNINTVEYSLVTILEYNPDIDVLFLFHFILLSY